MEEELKMFNNSNNEFNNYVFSNTLLDSAIQWVKENIPPEDVYDEEQLLVWLNEWLLIGNMQIVPKDGNVRLDTDRHEEKEV